MNANSFNQELSLLLKKITFEGKGINSYEFVDPEGADLPVFTAGSHIDVNLAPNMVRQYSLSNDPKESHRYVIAVLRDENGRGGSKALHETLRVQDLVSVSVPRNNFELDPETKRAVLIGGGIGITPIKSMAHELKARHIPYDLHYCAKNKSCVAFYEEIMDLADADNIHFHFDNGDPSQGLDLQSLLANQNDGEHLYYCGPGGFMEACKNASKHWSQGSVHFEHFKAPTTKPPAPSAGAADGYKVHLQRTGETIEVPAGMTVLEALKQAGVEVQTSCESGLCGACKVRYLQGEVDHQDFILDDDERSDYFTSCVSHVTSELIVLDL